MWLMIDGQLMVGKVNRGGVLITLKMIDIAKDSKVKALESRRSSFRISKDEIHTSWLDKVKHYFQVYEVTRACIYLDGKAND